jgi:hypothetical protein
MKVLATLASAQPSASMMRSVPIRTNHRIQELHGKSALSSLWFPPREARDNQETHSKLEGRFHYERTSIGKARSMGATRNAAGIARRTGPCTTQDELGVRRSLGEPIEGGSGAAGLVVLMLTAGFEHGDGRPGSM